MAFALDSRRITLIVAVTMALAAGLLTIRFLNTAQRPTEETTTIPTRPVLVASRRIHVHERIVPEMVTRVMRPATQVEAGAFGESRQALGTVALIEIPEGSPLTDAKLGTPTAVGVTGKLRPGLRAISIPVDFIKSVSALVVPGDRVDVLASNTRGRPRPTRAIIRGALVLAVNTVIEPTAQPSPTAANAAIGPSSVTLAVTPEQANLLTFADNTTALRLALRSPTEPIRSYPVQELDIGAVDENAASQPHPPLRANDPPVFIMPPSAPALNVPAPAAPAPVPQADVPLVQKPVLVIEGDRIVAGQR